MKAPMVLKLGDRCKPSSDARESAPGQAERPNAGPQRRSFSSGQLRRSGQSEPLFVRPRSSLESWAAGEESQSAPNGRRSD